MSDRIHVEPQPDGTPAGPAWVGLLIYGAGAGIVAGGLWFLASVLTVPGLVVVLMLAGAGAFTMAVFA